MTFWNCVLVLWIHKGYFVVKELLEMFVLKLSIWYSSNILTLKKNVLWIFVLLNIGSFRLYFFGGQWVKDHNITLFNLSTILTIIYRYFEMTKGENLTTVCRKQNTFQWNFVRALVDLVEKSFVEKYFKIDTSLFYF